MSCNVVLPSSSWPFALRAPRRCTHLPITHLRTTPFPVFFTTGFAHLPITPLRTPPVPAFFAAWCAHLPIRSLLFARHSLVLVPRFSSLLPLARSARCAPSRTRRTNPSFSCASCATGHTTRSASRPTRVWRRTGPGCAASASRAPPAMFLRWVFFACAARGWFLPLLLFVLPPLLLLLLCFVVRGLEGAVECRSTAGILYTRLYRERSNGVAFSCLLHRRSRRSRDGHQEPHDARFSVFVRSFP